MRTNECPALTEQSEAPHHIRIVPLKSKKRKSKLHQAFILGSWYGSGFLAIQGMFVMKDAVTPLPAIGMLLAVFYFTLCTVVNGGRS